MSHRSLSAQAGYSLIEVLVAITLLLVGALGTVSMIDGANATTLNSKQREGATNLAREIVEVARSLSYDKLDTSTIAAELQTRASLADASASVAGWQVERRGTVYTVAITACAFDDAKDSAGAHLPGENYCPGSATGATDDKNPDDYRKLDVTVTWAQRGGRTGTVPQTAIVNNPSGGLGPRITAFDCVTCFGPGDDQISGTTQTVAFQATSQPAASLNWAVDDGSSQGELSAGPTLWSFAWDIGQVDAPFSCGSNPDWTLDGTYVVNAQTRDSRGVPGNLSSRAVTIERSAPAPPCGLIGGRNGGAVDLLWQANDERDIVEYRVFRRPAGAETSPREVCVVDAARPLECYDDQPLDPAVHPTASYFVSAYDLDEGTDSADLLVAQTGNTPPSQPGPPTLQWVEGNVELTWPASSDSDGSIRFYRIYRDSQAKPAGRLDRTATTQPSYTDTDAGTSSRTYWITAVDDQFAESAFSVPVSTP